MRWRASWRRPSASACEVAQRNAHRLLKLVNALLDFSRIEAGRADGAFQPTDLAALTAELASQFRSACERAGLRLTVARPPLGEPAYVDREMWEKVVFNLLSNAFKFTFEGEIAVSLRREGPSAVLDGERQRHRHPGGRAAARVRALPPRRRARAAAASRAAASACRWCSELVRLHMGQVERRERAGRGTHVQRQRCRSARRTCRPSASAPRPPRPRSARCAARRTSRKR